VLRDLLTSRLAEARLTALSRVAAIALTDAELLPLDVRGWCRRQLTSIEGIPPSLAACLDGLTPSPRAAVVVRPPGVGVTTGNRRHHVG